ncbi:MAG TPA: DUF2605 domain-containing protein [Coleofasciculaceae cyanobacterium]|jgi:hypothetical protein
MLESSSNFPSESELLKTVLQPLLEDFQYWFAKGRSLLETHELDFLGVEQQTALLERFKQAQQEVGVSQALFAATGEQVGVDPSVMVSWHRLVTECWQVGKQFRREHQDI